ARARHAWVHLDDEHAPRLGVDGELDVRPSRFDADLRHHRARRVAHALELPIRKRHRGRYRYRVAGVHAHRIDVLDRAHDDEVVGAVSDDLELELLPTEHALFDEHLVNGRLFEGPCDLRVELTAVIRDAAAGAAEREARPHDRGVAD